MNLAALWNPFEALSKYSIELRSGDVPLRLVPAEVKKMTTAGPSVNPSVLGLFQDAHSITTSVMGQYFFEYIQCIKKANTKYLSGAQEALFGSFMDTFHTANRIYLQAMEIGLQFEKDEG